MHGRALLAFRKELQTECAFQLIPKKGTVEEMKCRLLHHVLTSVLTENHVRKYADNNAPSPFGFMKAAGPADSAPAAVVVAGDDPSQPSQSEPVMFGRQTFKMSQDEIQDKTSWFASIDEGPPVVDADNRGTESEIVARAVGGVVPLAAMIKITQGFLEPVEDQFAVLMSSTSAEVFLYCFTCAKCYLIMQMAQKTGKNNSYIYIYIVVLPLGRTRLNPATCEARSM